MRMIQLVPGTCEVFYCENCIRDLELHAGLEKLGHDVELVPLYLPLTAEGSGPSGSTQIFFGGINTYFRDKSRFFRRLPRSLTRALDPRRYHQNTCIRYLRLKSSTC